MHCLGTEESMHTEPEKVSKGILVFPAVLDTSSLSWDQSSTGIRKDAGLSSYQCHRLQI